MKLKCLVAAAVAMLACGLSHAGPFFIGGSYGNTAIEIDNASLNFDADDPGWKVFAGFRFMKFVGAEASYVDLGSPSDSSVTIDSTAFDAFGMGILPMGPFELFAKVGFVYWDSDITGAGNDNGTDGAYGIGAAFSLKKVAFRLEWEQFAIEDTDDVRMVSAGVEWRF